MAIAEKLQNIINEKSQQATMTNYGLTSGNQINSSTKFIDYPKYIFNAFLEALRNPDTLFTNLPKKSGTGSVISLNDTANAPMRIELGASELTQAGTPTPSSPQDIHTISGSNTIKVCGKNLFDYASASDTNNTFVSTYRIFEISGLVPNAKYTLNKMEFISSITGKYVYLWTTPSYPGGINQIIANPSEYHNTKIFNASADGKIYLTMYPNDTTTWNELIPYLKNAQIEAGENNTTYEPYISQEAEVDLGTNMFNKYTIFDGDIINGYFKIRLCSRQDLYLKAGTYTFSTNMPTTYKWLIQTQSVGVPPLDAYPTYDFEYGWTTDASKTFTLTNDGYFDLQIQKGSNQNLKVADIIDYDFQLVKGSEVLPFKEYREPIEYCKIGNYEDKFIRTSGSNLFDGIIEAGYININTGENTGTSNVRTKNYIAIQPNTQYTISSNTSHDTWACYYNSSKTFISNQQIKTGTSGTFTTPANAYYIRWYDAVSTGESPLWQLEVGTITTPVYEPYGSNEWYIKKNIGKVVLDGSGTWGIRDDGNYASNPYFTKGEFSSYVNSYDILCNQLTPRNISSSTQASIQRSSTSILCQPSNGILTTEDWKAWLNSNNLIIYLPLITPTYTKITGTLATQLENVYQKLLSYSGQTNISQINNDLSFNMSIQAIEK